MEAERRALRLRLAEYITTYYAEIRRQLPNYAPSDPEQIPQYSPPGNLRVLHCVAEPHRGGCRTERGRHNRCWLSCVFGFQLQEVPPREGGRIGYIS
jgi:hypothetical protein